MPQAMGWDLLRLLMGALPGTEEEPREEDQDLARRGFQDGLRMFDGSAVRQRTIDNGQRPLGGGALPDPLGLGMFGPNGGGDWEIRVWA